MVPRRLKLSRASFPKGREGSRASSPAFTVVFGPSKNGGCAVVVPKAVAKKAVLRHRIKRRMLEVLRPWCSKERFVVVYAKTAVASLSEKEMKEELTRILERAL